MKSEEITPLDKIPESEKMMVDLHCHPSIKPFGRAHPGSGNSNDPFAETSIWKYDPPTVLDKALNILPPGFTRFSQANFTAIHNGRVRVAFCALNPIEKGFFNARIIHTGKVADKIYNFITGIGEPKINFIQDMDDYWTEFKNEYKFYEKLNGATIRVDGKTLQYKLTRNYQDVEQNLMDPDTISAVLTVEGSYVFNPSISRPFNGPLILQNIDELKTKPFVPFLISISHHFYNHTGGHAKSLHGILGWALNQKFGLHEGMSNFGKVVIKKLLDKNNGKRIYIDMKHMSVQMRRDYYRLIRTDFPPEDNIPLIVSHGALNGFESIYSFDPTSKKKKEFYKGDVNFFDEEIIFIAKSNGIFGLQLDDRLVSGKKVWLRNIFHNKVEMQRFRAGILWNHIRRIAEILDWNNLDSWGTVAIGTDYDGIVDPPNGFWTSEEMPDLYECLSKCVSDYMKPGNNKLHQQRNSEKSPQEIMQNLFSENARRFMNKYYV